MKNDYACRCPDVKQIQPTRSRYTSYPTVPFWKENPDIPRWKQAFKSGYRNSQSTPDSMIRFKLFFTFTERIALSNQLKSSRFKEGPIRGPLIRRGMLEIDCQNIALRYRNPIRVTLAQYKLRLFLCARHMDNAAIETKVRYCTEYSSIHESYVPGFY